ncbi:Cellulose biosynthesis protein BcsQ [Collimonas sp. OK307]|uniref:hypothetical protein n=1 Tax=Collimonas sp. OK307 TaxID=1801620 RepID=UPI0008EB0114|nr:hypothetical protein [Collimonas sp. OK307]SFH70583.1 Cellulose biosynthesis protein BcsQ [Collimonas sp. OK307]
MIITIFSENRSVKRSVIALNLAAHCALNHRKVLLLDAASPQHALGWDKRRRANGGKTKITVRGIENLRSELENPASYYRSHYPDTIIDADGGDAHNTDAALIAADVLVIPFESSQGYGGEELIQRIETLRLFNPALRVLVVEVQAISAFGAAARTENNPAQAAANKILTATLAETVIHEWIDDRSTFDQGLSLFECEPRNERAIAEIKDLYKEIRRIRVRPLEPAANSLAILHALQRRTEEKELCQVGSDAPCESSASS